MKRNNFECLAINYFPKETGLFVVSTVNRVCNSAIAYGVEYSETLVFFYPQGVEGYGDPIWHGEHLAGSLYLHNRVSEWLRNNSNMDGFDDRRSEVYEQIRG